MSDEPHVYKSNDQVGLVVREAAESEKPVRITVDEVVYELQARAVTKSDDIWEEYDPEAVREAWEQGFGVLKGIDVSTLIDRIRDERSQEASSHSWPIS